MRYLILIAILCIGCAMPVKSASTTTDDVIRAWNDTCAGYNFAEYDPGLTMGQAYQGAAYALDETGLLQAMAAEVDCTLPPDVEFDDILNEVVERPEWFK